MYACECICASMPTLFCCAEIFDACHFMASFDAKALISFRRSVSMSFLFRGLFSSYFFFLGEECLSVLLENRVCFSFVFAVFLWYSVPY